MREIKFRAWVVDEYEEDGNTPKTFKMVNWFPQFFSNMSPVTQYRNEFPHKESKEVVLMQYIGLKDKNGTEIYEGDICKTKIWDAEIIFETIFSGGWFTIKEIKATEDYWTDLPTDYFYDCEILGNIYENPELLK